MTENPNYTQLFAQLESETDPVIRDQILTQIYQFNQPIAPEEAQLFGYMYDDYVEKNPGIVGNSFSSYVGVYINQEGEYTGIYP